MKEKNLDVAQENQLYHHQIFDIDVRRMGESLPLASYEAFKTLWGDPNVQEAWKGEDQTALPDKWVSDL